MRRGAILAAVLLSVAACGHAPDAAAPETTSVAARVTTTTTPAPPNFSIVGRATRDDGKPVFYVLVDPVNDTDDGYRRDVKRVLEALATTADGPDFSASVFDDRTLAADEYAHRADPPVEAKVPGVDAAPGSTVRLRLVAASIAGATVAFVPIGAESS